MSAATGWWFPAGSSKAHFLGADRRSLCGKWASLAAVTDVSPETGTRFEDECAACLKRLLAGGDR